MWHQPRIPHRLPCRARRAHRGGGAGPHTWRMLRPARPGRQRRPLMTAAAMTRCSCRGRGGQPVRPGDFVGTSRRPGRDGSGSSSRTAPDARSSRCVIEPRAAPSSLARRLCRWSLRGSRRGVRRPGPATPAPLGSVTNGRRRPCPVSPSWSGLSAARRGGWVVAGREPGTGGGEVARWRATSPVIRSASASQEDSRLGSGTIWHEVSTTSREDSRSAIAAAGDSTSLCDHRA